MARIHIKTTGLVPRGTGMRYVPIDETVELEKVKRPDRYGSDVRYTVKLKGKVLGTIEGYMSTRPRKVGHFAHHSKPRRVWRWADRLGDRLRYDTRKAVIVRMLEQRIADQTA